MTNELQYSITLYSGASGDSSSSKATSGISSNPRKHLICHFQHTQNLPHYLSSCLAYTPNGSRQLVAERMSLRVSYIQQFISSPDPGVMHGR